MGAWLTQSGLFSLQLWGSRVTAYKIFSGPNKEQELRLFSSFSGTRTGVRQIKAELRRLKINKRR